MRRALACAVALLPSLVLADVDARFAKLRDSAEALGGLGVFLDKYVGDCARPEMGGAECAQNAAAFRQKANGKRFYMIITEDSGGLIQMGPYDPSSGEYVLNVTPFFAAAGTALTQGAPSKTDANGNPVLPFIRVKGTVAEGENQSSVSRLVGMRALRMQVVFTPQGLWTLPKKGGGKITGVKARIDGVFVTVGRTGQPMGLWLNGR